LSAAMPSVIFGAVESDIFIQKAYFHMHTKPHNHPIPPFNTFNVGFDGPEYLLPAPSRANDIKRNSFIRDI
jgi:hypothetical protein